MHRGGPPGGTWSAGSRPRVEGSVLLGQPSWALGAGSEAGQGRGRCLHTATLHGPGHTLLQGHTESPPGPPKDPVEGHLPGGKGGAGPRLGVGLTGR